MTGQRWMPGLALVLFMSASLQADTLYLRDGSRVQGELVSVRNGTIEFEERRGYGSGRVLRLDRDEVVRIEFENNRRSGNDFSSGGRPSGMRERTTIVSGDVPWNDTGIDVRAGQTIYFEAQGQVRWGRDRRDGGLRAVPDPGPRSGRPGPQRPVRHRGGPQVRRLHRLRDGRPAG